MKRLFFATLFVLSFCPYIVFGQNNESELVFAEAGAPGTAVVLAWSFSPKATISDNLVLENAIRGCLFNGIKENVPKRIPSKKALVEAGETTNKDYFNDFFNSGKYLNYCRLGMNGYLEQGNLIKVRRGYRIGKIVVIEYDQLRRQLEKDGIIRGLDSGF